MTRTTRYLDGKLMSELLGTVLVMQCDTIGNLLTLLCLRELTRVSVTCMHVLTLGAQAQPTTLPRRSLQLQQRLWRAQVLESLVSARSRLTRRLNVHTFCSAHIGFHQQRLAADIRTGTKSADFKPLEVEIRYYFSGRLALASESVIMPTPLVFSCLKGSRDGYRASSCRLAARSQFLCISSGTCLCRPGPFQSLNDCNNQQGLLCYVVSALALSLAVEFACKRALQIHQTMKADEEYKALKAERTHRASMTKQQLTMHRSTCLVALAYSHQVMSQPEGVVGTLDLYAVRALEGEVLIGKLCSSTATKSCLHIPPILGHTASASYSSDMSNCNLCLLFNTHGFRLHVLLWRHHL